METDVKNTHSISGKRKNVETKRKGIFFFLNLALEYIASKKDNTNKPHSVLNTTYLLQFMLICVTHTVLLYLHTVWWLQSLQPVNSRINLIINFLPLIHKLDVIKTLIWFSDTAPRACIIIWVFERLWSCYYHKGGLSTLIC